MAINLFAGALATGVLLAAGSIARASLHALILHRLRAPRLTHNLDPSDLGPDARELRIPTANGKQLFALFLSAQGLAPRPAVVVIHGWGANAALMLPAARPLYDAGFSVLLIDARCHGASDGEAFSSLPRFAEDIGAALDWLHGEPTVDPARLAVLGHSVGGAAALLCASRRDDIAAVISLSAFAHPRETMQRFLAGQHVPFFPLGWYVMGFVQRVIGHRFDDIAPLNTMPRVRCPVLLAHGRDDEITPFDDAERLQAVGVRSQLLPLSAGHDLTTALADNSAALVIFLQCLPGTGAIEPT